MVNPRQIGQEIRTSMPPGNVSGKIQAQARECKEVGAGLGLFQLLWVFPSRSVVKNLPAVQGPQETQIRSPGQEDPVEEGTATHSSILAGSIPWAEEPGGLQSIGLQESDTTEVTWHACM